ncbi:MAG TPA: hypothetical protein VEF04_00815 [Blastocatellia bacterium]|nr:hypothetical protein [Blastocatellia bacterium]
MALYALPDTGAVINTETLPEQVVDQLIQKYGGQPPLLERKRVLEQARIAQGNQRSQEQMNQEQIQAEALKRTDNALQQKLDAIFGQAGQYAAEGIERQFAPQRSRVAAEQAAMGRLGSGVGQYSLGQVDQNKSNAMAQIFGNLAGQRASGQLDISKTIEGILQGERRAEDQRNQFGQSMQFNRDSLLNEINQGRENRGLQLSMFDAQQRQQRDLSGKDIWDKALMATQMWKNFTDPFMSAAAAKKGG